MHFLQRRTFLQHSAYGVGAMALAALHARGGTGGVPGLPHHAPKAKRVIHLCMAGGPSQFETLDYEPVLKANHDKPFPESFTRGQQLAQLQNTVLRARGPSFAFKKFG